MFAADQLRRTQIRQEAKKAECNLNGFYRTTPVSLDPRLSAFIRG
jgi:hypothetical protein